MQFKFLILENLTYDKYWGKNICGFNPRLKFYFMEPNEAPPQFSNDQCTFVGPIGCSWEKMQVISYTKKIIESTDPYHFSENHRIMECFGLGYQPQKRPQSSGNSVQCRRWLALGSSNIPPFPAQQVWDHCGSLSSSPVSTQIPRGAHVCARIHTHKKNTWYTHSWLQRWAQRAVSLLASPRTHLKSCDTDMETTNNHILFSW